MIKSLYSGVSGMKGFQVKMDVIANNIANVNTTAFKSSRTSFQDMMSQTLVEAQAPGENFGGTNPKQVGLGMRVGSIDAMMQNGDLQPTDRELDFAIEGNGFFAVTSVLTEDGDPDRIMYTRDGSFFRDSIGNLVTASGERVLGYEINDDGSVVMDGDKPKLMTLSIPGTNPGDDTEDLQSYSVDSTGNLVAIYGEGTLVTLGRIAVTNFSTPEALERLGGNNFNNTRNSGDPQYGSPGDAGFGIIRQGSLEMSNVDLASEFTEMVITSRAYSANSRTITTSDDMLQELINLKR